MLETLITMTVGAIALNLIPLTTIIAGGLAVGVGIGIVHVFWEGLLSFAQKCVKAAQKTIKKITKAVINGVKVFVQKLRGSLQEIVKYYAQLKEENRWIETVQIRVIDPSEVPEDILRRANQAQYQEVDITKDLGMKLTA